MDHFSSECGQTVKIADTSGRDPINMGTRPNLRECVHVVFITCEENKEEKKHNERAENLISYLKNSACRPRVKLVNLLLQDSDKS